MKYLMLLHDESSAPNDPGSAEYVATFQAWDAVLQPMREAGVLIDCAPLSATSSATTVRVRDGAAILTDGPAAELHEQVGGYALIECANLDEALGWAARSPAARDASVEVRPVVEVRSR